MRALVDVWEWNSFEFDWFNSPSTYDDDGNHRDREHKNIKMGKFKMIKNLPAGGHSPCFSHYFISAVDICWGLKLLKTWSAPVGNWNAGNLKGKCKWSGGGGRRESRIFSREILFPAPASHTREKLILMFHPNPPRFPPFRNNERIPILTLSPLMMVPSDQSSQFQFPPIPKVPLHNTKPELIIKRNSFQ